MSPFRGRLLFPLLLLLASARVVFAQGPPYQTDDPMPVDYQHYEFYVFGGVDGTPKEIDSTGPSIEFNWGAIPRVQLHAVLASGSVHPSDKPLYAPDGAQPGAFGWIDSEIGVKVALIKETRYFPQVGSFPMFELPSGDADRGLGIGKVYYKIPLWLQKNAGDWLFDGGAGYAIVPQTGYKNYAYTGWLVKRKLNERLELGAEVFAHGREGGAAPQYQASTLVDAGGYYHFKNHPGEQFLFCYGHSIAGQTENYAYVGMYWTWGKSQKGKETMLWLDRPRSVHGS